MKNLAGLVGLVLGALMVTGAWAAEPVLMAQDLDRDGYKEAVMVYEDGRIARSFLDMNADGKIDMVVSYKNGYRDHAEKDADADGRTDTWVSYYFTGVPWKVAEDMNRDGAADYWTYLKDGRIYKWELDRNLDGKPDVTTDLVQGPGGQTQTLVRIHRQMADDDFDGVYERMQGAHPGRIAALPQSLAEALLGAR